MAAITSRQRTAPYCRLFGSSGHPAQRTTCASGFECADLAALSFPPLAAGVARGAPAACVPDERPVLIQDGRLGHPAQRTTCAARVAPHPLRPAFQGAGAAGSMLPPPPLLPSHHAARTPRLPARPSHPAAYTPVRPPRAAHYVRKRFLRGPGRAFYCGTRSVQMRPQARHKERQKRQERQYCQPSPCSEYRTD